MAIGHATWATAYQTQKAIVITDNYNDGDMNKTITNDAEFVIKSLAPSKDVRVIYRDTEGRWDELKHNGKGKFTGFSPSGCSTLQEVVDKIAGPQEL